MSYDLDSTDYNIKSALSTGRRSKISQNDEGLTSRELKLKLLEVVRNNGIVDSVKVRKSTIGRHYSSFYTFLLSFFI